MKKSYRTFLSGSFVLCSVIVAACSGGDHARRALLPEAGTGGSDGSGAGGTGGAGGAHLGSSSFGGASGNPTGLAGATASGGALSMGGTASDSGSGAGGSVVAGGAGGAVSSLDSGASACAANLQTDNDNCGRCGRVCPPASVCTAGHCGQVLANTLESPIAITLDASHVYFIQASIANVYSIPLTGGVPTALGTSVPVSLGAPSWDLVLFNGKFYFGSDYYNVVSVPVGGGAATIISANEKQPYGMVAQGNFLYWANNYQSAPAIRRADLSKVPATVSSLDPEKGVDAGVSSLESPMFIRATPNYLIWANSGQPTIYRSNLDGTNVVRLATTSAPIGGLTIDATDVYYTTDPQFTSGSMGVVPIAGGVAKDLSTIEGHPAGMFADSTDVYWANEGTLHTNFLGSSVRRYHKADHSITTAAYVNPLNPGVPFNSRPIGGAEGVAADANYVYWFSTGSQVNSGYVASATKD